MQLVGTHQLIELISRPNYGTVTLPKIKQQQERYQPLTFLIYQISMIHEND